MSLPQFTYHLVEFVGFLTSAVVCALASQAYLGTRKRSVLLIAVAGGLGAVVTLLPEMGGRPTWGLWYFEMAARIVDGLIWLVGLWLLLRDYASLVGAQRRAAPNGGPAERPGNSGVSSGPQSVS